MFEKLKNKRREISELHQQQLESLPDHVSNPTLKKMVIHFTIIFSLLLSFFVTIGIFIYPIYLFEVAGWVVILMYVSGFMITIPTAILIFYLIYTLFKLALIRFFITDSFDIKLLIAGLISTIILVFIAEYWMICHAFHIFV